MLNESERKQASDFALRNAAKMTEALKRKDLSDILRQQYQSALDNLKSKYLMTEDQIRAYAKAGSTKYYIQDVKLPEEYHDWLYLMAVNMRNSYKVYAVLLNPETKVLSLVGQRSKVKKMALLLRKLIPQLVRDRNTYMKEKLDAWQHAYENQGQAIFNLGGSNWTFVSLNTTYQTVPKPPVKGEVEYFELELAWVQGAIFGTHVIMDALKAAEDAVPANKNALVLVEENPTVEEFVQIASEKLGKQLALREGMLVDASLLDAPDEPVKDKGKQGKAQADEPVRQVNLNLNDLYRGFQNVLAMKLPRPKSKAVFEREMDKAPFKFQELQRKLMTTGISPL